jgi:phosphomannomutase
MLSELAGLKVRLWEQILAAHVVPRDIPTDLEAEVVGIEPLDSIVAVETEVVGGELRAKIVRCADAQSLDAIVSSDRDGDRPLLADA